MADSAIDSIYDGTGMAPLAQLVLRAGPLTAIYEAGGLRTIRYGEHEIVRGIYMAVRNHNWDTIPGAISNEQIDVAPTSFTISYTSEHCLGPVDFVWRAEIIGTPDGTIRFQMEGETRATFLRNRIGFCVLHPSDCAGGDCLIEQVDGQRVESTFPLHISPHQPFKEMRAITHTVAPGVQAEVRMIGDTFEMEDQRNWTDASYKIYCTPLEIPYPVEVAAGTTVVQEVVLRLLGENQEPRTQNPFSNKRTKEQQNNALSEGSRVGNVTLSPGHQVTVSSSHQPPATSHQPPAPVTLSPPQAWYPIPSIGLGMASDGVPLSEGEIALLRVMGLGHLRVDLVLSDPGLPALLEQATNEAYAIGARLEVAVFLSDDAERELGEFLSLLDRLKPPVAHWLIFHQSEKTVSAHWAKLARRYLSGYTPFAPLGGGTNAYFTELNRFRPPVEALDLVCYSLNPQVHAFDNASLVETLTAQAVTVASARQFCGDKPLAITPVTFRPRFNPNATGPERTPSPGELPDQVDPRQMSLFGAAWTVGSLANLATCGLHSLTYYETIGWRGVLERTGGSPAPERFGSTPGAPFPLFHVLADLGGFVGGQAGRLATSAPLQAEGIALERDGRVCRLVANLAMRPLEAVVEGLPASVQIRTLDSQSVAQATHSSSAFRESTNTLQTQAGRLNLELLPFAVVRIDDGW